MSDYIIVLNKPCGVTSAKALNTIKHTICKKVGHTGTLDKFASGVLIALTGRYTKLCENYMNLPKTYKATIVFGKQTDTLDREGQIVKTSDNIPTIENIEKILSKKFIGTILQEPPKYSALHINGKRASERARDGEEFEIKERPITIYSNKIISYDKGILVARFVVSRGTYIRSIARDLGCELNSCAYLLELEREQIGPFSINTSITADDKNTLLNEYSKRVDNSTYVCAIGVFDGVHKGHKKIIQSVISEAKKINAKSLIITFDSLTKDSTLPAIMSIEEKKNNILSFGVNKCIVLHWDENLKNTSGATFLLELFKRYDIQKIVLGRDFRIGCDSGKITADDLTLFFNKKDIIIQDYVLENGKKISSSNLRTMRESLSERT